MYDYKMSEKDWRESEWNPTNFEKVVIKYQGRIYNFIYNMLLEPHLAQDLTQDTFLGAYKSLCFRAENRYKGAEAENSDSSLIVGSTTISTWLYTIARNKAVDEMRRQKTLPLISLWYFDEMGKENERTTFTPIQGVGVGELENRLVMHDELERAIRKVGRDRLTAFLLFLYGFSYLEICRMTGCKLSKDRKSVV